MPLDHLPKKPLLRGLPVGDEFIRYMLGSGVALVADFSILLILTELIGLHYLVSAAIGFVAGAVTLYVLSIGFIFTERRLTNPRAEFVIFFTVGIIGLAINQTSMYWLVSMFGIGYSVAKVFTVFVVFSFNFSLRRTLLFGATEKAEIQ